MNIGKAGKGSGRLGVEAGGGEGEEKGILEVNKYRLRLT